jgi:NADPH:quinone reductase-like Zn-dependent oxidoreductase
MKAIVQKKFGPPDVLQFVDIDEPQIGPEDVLVRVHAAALNPHDWHMLRGDPYVARLMGVVGLTKPKPPVVGVDGAGVVEAVGANVRDVRAGDEVLGRFEGSLAEYARAEADQVVPKPARLTFEQAAAVTMAGQTALRAIRDVGLVRAGHRVLINGAAGGVGSFAVQIATALGAEVTGVCSTAKVDMVRSLGADHVVDYTVDDIDGGQHYDVILDIGGHRPLRQLRRALTGRGTLVIIGSETDGRWLGGFDRSIRALLLSPFVRQTLAPLTNSENAPDLTVMAGLIESGQVTPVIDRTYPLHEAAAAIRRLLDGTAHGKVVIHLSPRSVQTTAVGSPQ